MKTDFIHNQNKYHVVEVPGPPFNCHLQKLFLNVVTMTKSRHFIFQLGREREAIESTQNPIDVSRV